MNNPSREISLTYAGSSLDRLSEQRGDAALVESLRMDARNFVLAGESFVLAKRGEGFDAGQAYYINEEEVPRTGTRLTAAYNRTRTRSGRVALWVIALALVWLVWKLA